MGSEPIGYPKGWHLHFPSFGWTRTFSRFSRLSFCRVSTRCARQQPSQLDERERGAETALKFLLVLTCEQWRAKEWGCHLGVRCQRAKKGHQVNLYAWIWWMPGTTSPLPWTSSACYLLLVNHSPHDLQSRPLECLFHYGGSTKIIFCCSSKELEFVILFVL